MSWLYNTFVYQPLYNMFIFLMDLGPWIDAGIAVAILTLIVKFILYPLAKSAVLTQRSMKRIEPQVRELREKYATDPKLQAEKMMALYKEAKVNPFASFLTLLIQIPILWAVYAIFQRSGFPTIKTDILYSWVKVPDPIQADFINIFGINERSILLAVIAGICVFIQMKITQAITQQNLPNAKAGSQEAMMLSVMKTMTYMVPGLVAIGAYSSVAVAIYFIASALFGIGQDIYLKKFVIPRLDAQTKA